VLAGGVLVATNLWAVQEDKHHPKGKADAKHDKPHAGEHEAHGGGHAPLTAADEVGDQDEEWPIFHELGISLPLVGWFEIAGYKVPTKYMWLLLISASLCVGIYTGLAKRVQDGSPPKGPFWHFFESLLTFIRNEVAKPNFPEHAHHGEHGKEEHGHDAHAAQGHDAHAPAPHAHPADKYVPFLWTLFIFILFTNLLGMFPFLGSATANVFVTGGLALIVFVVLHGAASVKMGPLRYLASQWPKIDLPAFYGIGWLFKNVICLMIFVIELLGTAIKSFVLAVRLFANMYAGHMVLASILLFIVAAKDSSLFWVVTTSSVLGVVALSLLELFVAFLQAYIFTFLTALFMGMALNPEH
jgi:F-type H+-transporting ATPase subunit a